MPKPGPGQAFRITIRSMNTLVTGASGFVGSNLVEALNARRWSVRALIRPTASRRALDGLDYDTAAGDVLDREALMAAMKGIECVFHVAAVVDDGRADLATLYRVNVDGTRNVLEAALHAGVRRVVVTSSVAALGMPDWRMPADESHEFNLSPLAYPYGYSKVLAEQVTQAYVRRGLDAVIVNPAIVLGPRDVHQVSGRILVTLKKRAIPFYPPGGASVIDAADVAEGHIAAAERGRTGARYILAGEHLWHRELMGTAAGVVGRPQPWIRLPRAIRLLEGPVEALRKRKAFPLPINGAQIRMAAETMWFDSARARRELNLTTRSWRESCERAWAWYRANGLV